MEENKIVIYQTEDGQTQIDVRLENDTVWLNVAQMAELFDKEESNVRRHIINAFREDELERDENNVQKIHVNGVKNPSMLLMRMLWRLSMACATSLEAQRFLAMRKTIPLRAV